jgi:UDP:flavonoid glycosyltransferase YjiC (YdhE family)
MLALARGIVAAGARVVVFAPAAFRARVEAAGGIFHDFFVRRPMGAVDALSQPVSVRHVSYAGFRAAELADEIRAVGADLVVYSSFSVVGFAAARRLGLPSVCMCSGPDLQPARFREFLRTDPPVRLAPVCLGAVARLRDDFGIADASPFSYVSSLSPLLNLYPEPPEYLPASARAAFEPLAFFGCLDLVDAALPPPPPRDPSPTRRVYVSFGTVVWRYYADAAAAALRTIVADLRARPDVEALVTLGRGVADVASVADLDAPNVRVVAYADQPRALADADVFVTHHGLNSTHEAAWARVPMLSYPFFWDQPALAATCARLGIALPIAREPRGAPDLLAEAWARAETLRPRLADARAWEERVIAGRADVVRRVLALAATPRS